MKLSPLAAALLLATPLTFAQTATNPPPRNDTVGQQAGRVFDRAEDATSRTVNPPPGEPTIGQKADGVFDRMEAGTKRIWDRMTGKTESARTDGTASDSRTMGAPAADPTVPRRSDTSR